MKYTLLAFAALAAQISPADLGDVRLKGYVGQRLDAMIERHVIGTDVDYITAPFLEKTERHNWWQTEFWGKYMHSAVPFRDFSGSKKLAEAIDFGVGRILSSQEANGYIGNYPDELRCGEGWDVWGMKYTMMGLLHYYDGEKANEKGAKALAACRRLCDYVIAELGPNGKRGRELWQTGNWSGFASSSILEPVVWLYNRTKEQKYLDFATYLVKGMTEPEAGPRLVDLALKGLSVADRNGYGNKAESHGGYVMKHNRWKAYEMMSCYQGLLEYYQVTGRKDLFDAALATGNQILADEINLAGGCACSEAWFHGRVKQHLPYTKLQETCVTTTWMRLCEKLLDLTDDPKWADEIERSFYNVYLAAMKLDGSAFSAYVPLTGCRTLGHDHCRMHTDCCTANGPRGALCFLKKYFSNDGKTATFNFYGTARAKGFDMYSTYPRDTSATITSHTEGPLALRLRIPRWSAKTVVKLNGKAVGGVKAGSYFTLSRTWRLGDTIDVVFDMPVVAHTLGEAVAPGGAFSGEGGKRPVARPHYVAFTRGPILLARDSRFGDGDLTEPFRAGVRYAEGQKVDGFSAVRSPLPEMWMAFSATLPIGSHAENAEARNPSTVFFCDYASAGDTWQRDNYYRTWFPIEFGPTE